MSSLLMYLMYLVLAPFLVPGHSLILPLALYLSSLSTSSFRPAPSSSIFSSLPSSPQIFLIIFFGWSLVIAPLPTWTLAIISFPLVLVFVILSSVFFFALVPPGLVPNTWGSLMSCQWSSLVFFFVLVPASLVPNTLGPLMSCWWLSTVLFIVMVPPSLVSNTLGSLMSCW